MSFGIAQGCGEPRSQPVRRRVLVGVGVLGLGLGIFACSSPTSLDETCRQTTEFGNYGCARFQVESLSIALNPCAVRWSPD